MTWQRKCLLPGSRRGLKIAVSLQRWAAQAAHTRLSRLWLAGMHMRKQNTRSLATQEQELLHHLQKARRACHTGVTSVVLLCTIDYTDAGIGQGADITQL